MSKIITSVMRLKNANIGDNVCILNDKEGNWCKVTKKRGKKIYVSRKVRETSFGENTKCLIWRK